MYKYKLNLITFKDGQTIDPKKLTVIVGANNCGKSRILKDIKSITTEKNNNNAIIVNDVNFTIPVNMSEFQNSYSIQSIKDANGQMYIKTLSADLSKPHNIPVGIDWETTFENVLKKQDKSTMNQFSYWFGSFFISLFLTEDRLKLTKETESSDIRDNISNLLQAFYKEGKITENKLREVVKKTFQIDIALDYSSLRKLLFRIGNNFDDLPSDTREQLLYFKDKEKLDEQGDGIRSFVATILAILVGQKSILLLDEPESFLHPPTSL